MATKYQRKGLHVVFANPFKSRDSASDTVLEQLQKDQVPEQVKGFSVHRIVTHPRVSKHGPSMAPGWNCGNDEERLRNLPSCYVIFDRSGQLVFQGRSNIKEIEERIRPLLSRRKR